MSRENVEIVRRAFDAFLQGDMEGVLRLCDEDIVVIQPVELPGVPPQHRGHRGVLEAFGIWPGQCGDYRIEILGMIEAGDHVIVNTLQGGRGKQSGVAVEMPFTCVFRLKEGKFVEWRIIMLEEQARNWLELAPG
jgi:ketosteroid isomerase-like protein